jgi:hypothetical protein
MGVLMGAAPNFGHMLHKTGAARKRASRAGASGVGGTGELGRAHTPGPEGW